MRLRSHIKRSVGDDGRGIDRCSEVDFHQNFLLLCRLKNHKVAVLVSQKHLAVGYQRRAPHVRLHVVNPVFLSRVGV